MLVLRILLLVVVGSRLRARERVMPPRLDFILLPLLLVLVFVVPVYEVPSGNKLETTEDHCDVVVLERMMRGHQELKRQQRQVLGEEGRLQ